MPPAPAHSSLGAGRSLVRAAARRGSVVGCRSKPEPEPQEDFMPRMTELLIDYDDDLSDEELDKRNDRVEFRMCMLSSGCA